MLGLKYLDYASIAILILILLSVIIRRLYVQRHSKIFIVMLTITLLSTIADILSVTNKVGYMTVYLSNVSYFVLHTSLALSYCVYIFELTGILDSFKKHKFKSFLLLLPYLIILGLIVTNFFTPILFSINKDKIDLAYPEFYKRGKLIPIIYGLTALYLVISAIYVVHYRNMFSKKQLVSLLVIYILVSSSIAFQMIDGTILIEMFAFTISLMCIANSAEEVSLLINHRTKCGSFYMYQQILKKNYVHKTSTHIIYLRIVNHDDFFKTMNYNIVIEQLRDFSQELQTKYKAFDSSYKVYDVENGIFAIICKDYDSLVKIIGEINNDFIAGYYDNEVLNINYKLYYLDTSDIKNLAKLLKFHTLLFEDAFLETTKINYNEIIKENSFNIDYNIKNIIETALDTDNLLIYFDPIYSLKTDSFDSVEILSRIYDAKYGLIYPKMYIKKSIKLNLIKKIDDVVLNKVIEFINSSIFSYLKIKHVNINVATEELFDPNYATNFIDKLKKARINPSILSIEIIEKGYSDKYKVIKNNIKILRENNVGVILDDYGIGYSNIESIIELDFTGIKFDQVLFSSLNKNNTKTVIEHEITSIKSLKRDIIIEGIENENDLNFIKDLDTNYIQGYHISGPLEYNDFIKFIQEKEYNN